MVKSKLISFRVTPEEYVKFLAVKAVHSYLTPKVLFLRALQGDLPPMPKPVAVKPEPPAKPAAPQCIPLPDPDYDLEEYQRALRHNFQLETPRELQQKVTAIGSDLYKLPDESLDDYKERMVDTLISHTLTH